MPVYLSDREETEAPARWTVHIKRPGVDVRGPALCGDRYGANVVAEEDEAVPYLIGNVETLCDECRAKQFTS